MLKMKKTLSLCIVMAVVITSLFAGCGQKQAAESEKSSAKGTAVESTSQELKPVKLKYFIVGNPQKDLPLVNEEINKITQEKINATMDIVLISWGDWTEKMNVIMASGEEYDLTFSAPWLAPDYLNAVGKNAFVPLDDLIDTYAPKLKALVPKDIWNATRVGGKIYGAINWQIAAMPYGILLDEGLVKKYNFDVSGVKKISDLEPLLDACKNGETDKVGILPDWLMKAPVIAGFDSIGNPVDPGWVKLDDTEMKVVNQYETKEFREQLDLYHDWYKKEYIRKDILTAPSDDLINGKYIGETIFPTKPNAEVEMSNSSKVGQKFVMQSITKPLITTERAIATMTSISRTSANPERAMMYIELVNSDEKLYNTLAFGIEGTHWVKKGDRQIDFAPGLDAKTTGYAPNTSWEFGRQALAYYWPNEKLGIWDECEKQNADAQVSPLLGFNFNPEPVKAELAKISALNKEIITPIATGAIDIDVYLPKLLQKLKNAGADKVIAEKQKQLDEWKASK